MGMELAEEATRERMGECDYFALAVAVGGALQALGRHQEKGEKATKLLREASAEGRITNVAEIFQGKASLVLLEKKLFLKRPILKSR